MSCARFRPLARLLFCATLAAAVAAPLGARAQDAEQPPYETDLLRLSEVLGAIHYLRELCGADDGTLWRDRMNALLEVEAEEPERRRKLIDRFNRGYRGFASVYRDCTGSARSATEQYMAEGEQLAGEIATRYSR